MHVISRKTLCDFWLKHSDAEEALKAWFREAKAAKWASFDDIKARYNSADAVPDNRVVFNIKGNSYRLIVRINYNSGCIFIRFVGTHAEYDKVNAETI